MQIRILEPDLRSNAWFNNHVGETFPVIGGLSDGIPPQWTVDVSRLVDAGLMGMSCRGLAYVFAYCAEVVTETEEE